MNTSTATVFDTTFAAPISAGLDEVTVSMVEVDAAAARAALTHHLHLPAADLEHPSVVAVLAAVVAAGWRPPTPAGTRGPGTVLANEQVPALFGAGPAADRVGIGSDHSDHSGPPGRAR